MESNQPTAAELAKLQVEREANERGLARAREKSFNGRHRVARVAKFNAALERKKDGRKAQRKLKKAAQRRNRG